MVDQVQSLRASGVSAVIVSSGGREGSVLLASEDALENASLVYCSPEGLVQDKWREMHSRSQACLSEFVLLLWMKLWC